MRRRLSSVSTVLLTSTFLISVDTFASGSLQRTAVIIGMNSKGLDSERSDEDKNLFNFDFRKAFVNDKEEVSRTRQRLEEVVDRRLDYSKLSDGYQDKNIPVTPRIIGGSEAPIGRYPYAVTLTYLKQHVCGGSLIADDIILSAAHCSAFFDGIQIGRHDLGNENEVYERFVFEKYVIHPNYQIDNNGPDLNNDFMIIKLYGWSAKDSIKLNVNPDIPANDKDPLTVMGWGVTNTATEQMSDVLKEVSVNYMTNQECEMKEGYLDGHLQKFSLKGQITDAMLCAKDVNEDACQGDSGGPLIQRGNLPGDDLQVGVVSWGLGCAHSIFPGIYSRISTEINWIRNVVCDLAEFAPENFDCEERTPAPISGLKQAVTVEINLDRYSSETGWLLRSDDGSYAYAPLGVYGSTPNQRVVSVVELDVDITYTFIMLDAYGDGISFDNGNYKLWRGDESSPGQLLASGSVYTHSKQHKFFLPREATPQPTHAPVQKSKTSPPTSKPTSAPTTTRPYVTIAIKLDNFPEESSWAITAVKDQAILATKAAGTYSGKNHALIIEKVYLYGPDKGSTRYIFAIFDAARDGLCCKHGPGFFQVYLGPISEKKILVDGEKFAHLAQFEFIIEWDGGPTTPSLSKPFTHKNNKLSSVQYNNPLLAQDFYYHASSSPPSLKLPNITSEHKDTSNYELDQHDDFSSLNEIEEKSSTSASRFLWSQLTFVCLLSSTLCFLIF